MSPKDAVSGAHFPGKVLELTNSRVQGTPLELCTSAPGSVGAGAMMVPSWCHDGGDDVGTNKQSEQVKLWPEEFGSHCLLPATRTPVSVRCGHLCQTIPYHTMPYHTMPFMLHAPDSPQLFLGPTNSHLLATRTPSKQIHAALSCLFTQLTRE